MPSISVTIITRDEEENIESCLESVKWADELIVVDSMSTDRTADICRRYTDKVFIQEWKGYSAQKNTAIEKATLEWIFSIDADERVSVGLRDEIREVINNPNALDGYLMPRRAYFAGRWIRHGGWYPDYQLRLFRKGKGKFVERGVHERAEVKGNIGRLKGHIEHYTYKDISEFISRMDRYSTLAAMEYKSQGKRGSLLRIIFAPAATFIRMYILKLGFMDGYHGFLLAVLYSYYTFTKYAKLKELNEPSPPFA